MEDQFTIRTPIRTGAPNETGYFIPVLEISVYTLNDLREGWRHR